MKSAQDLRALHFNCRTTRGRRVNSPGGARKKVARLDYERGALALIN